MKKWVSLICCFICLLLAILTYDNKKNYISKKPKLNEESNILNTHVKTSPLPQSSIYLKGDIL